MHRTCESVNMSENEKYENVPPTSESGAGPRRRIKNPNAGKQFNINRRTAAEMENGTLILQSEVGINQRRTAPIGRRRTENMGGHRSLAESGYSTELVLRTSMLRGRTTRKRVRKNCRAPNHFTSEPFPSSSAHAASFQTAQNSRAKSSMVASQL